MYRGNYRLLLSFSRVGFWGEGKGGGREWDIYKQASGGELD